MIMKKTKTKLSAGTNSLEKEVTVYYLFFITIFKSVKEIVETF